MSSLPKAATRQRRDCDLNPGPSATEPSTLTTRLPSHPVVGFSKNKQVLSTEWKSGVADGGGGGRCRKMR